MVSSSKLIFRICYYSVLILIFGQFSNAVAADTNTDPFKNWYNQSQYAIEVPFTSKNLEKLKNHLHAYNYMVIYMPANSNDHSRFRIGYFKSQESAYTFKNASDFIFESQSIVQVSLQEQQSVLKNLNEDDSSKPEFYVFAITTDVNEKTAISSKKSLDKAKQLYLSEQYQAAINHYRFLMMFADDHTAAWANELIGLCQEKLHQPDSAIKTYKELLENYPKSNGTARVQQRLQSLQTANSDGNLALRSSNQQQQDIQTRGVIGQYYRSLSRQVNDEASEEILSLLSTDFDIRSSARFHGHSIQARVNGFSLKDSLDGRHSETRINRLYVDYLHLSSDTQLVLGRQKKFDSGVFTSFDGATISYPLRDNLHIGVSAGKPIYFYDVYENLDYFFYSSQIKWDVTDHWRINSYYIDQSLNSVTDREAFGIQTQFSNTTFSTALNIDYDLAFAEINNILWSGSYNLTQAINLTATIGQQRSPFLTATNILIGQADLDLSLYLQSKENQANLLEDALARTALNDYYSFAISGKITKKIQLIFDYYDSTLSNIPNNELLLGLPGAITQIDSFNQSHLGLQSIFQDFLFDGGSTILGWQQNDGSTSKASQVYINEKIRVSQFWSLGVKVLSSDVQYSTNNDSQKQLRYSLQIDIRPFRNMELSIEAGNEGITTDRTNTKFSSDYIFAGYRVNF